MTVEIYQQIKYNSAKEQTVFCNFERIIMDKKVPVNGKEYDILKLLVKRKGGYSYLANDDYTFFS